MGGGVFDEGTTDEAPVRATGFRPYFATGAKESVVWPLRPTSPWARRG